MPTGDDDESWCPTPHRHAQSVAVSPLSGGGSEVVTCKDAVVSSTSASEPVALRPTDRRIRVVGNSGAGKTTFARVLADRLGVGHLELDAVFWDAGWSKRDPEEARGLIREFLGSRQTTAGWVADGNWDEPRAGLLDDADVLVWLDYPRRLVTARVVRRSLERVVLRRELWHGNRERARNLVSRDVHQNVVLWSWRAHDRVRDRYLALSGSASARVVRLGSPREARSWLDRSVPR
jgi:adenylate kinase family enzyme